MIPWPPNHPGESYGNESRQHLAAVEPRSLRTLTPSLAVIQRAEGAFLWTVDGRQLTDFTSGVLVANLGHYPLGWLRRVEELLGAQPLNIYNAITPIEIEAGIRLLKLINSRLPKPKQLRIAWAASGSEAVHKALWASMRRNPKRDVILATRNGFHGKKGLANAVTGCETDPERDPRVTFISFPRDECRDLSERERRFDAEPYRLELSALHSQFGERIGTLITEPYLGGGGSFHPSPMYLQLLQEFCREHDIIFVLDEVQSNFGRTGPMFAFEKYRLDPDVVILGKSLANGVPVAAAVGRADLFDPLEYGELSDTWSANPLSCAAVVATLEAYDNPELLPHVRAVSEIIESGLVKLKDLPMIKHIRGEQGGMVWGIETSEYGGCSAAEWANRLVLAAYHGDGTRGVHLLGPLAKTVIRIAPPLTITESEATEAIELLGWAFRKTIAED